MPDNFQNLSDLLDLDNDPEGFAESVKLDFAIELEERLRRQCLSYKDLAQLLGTSQAYVSKVMRGDCNLTIDSLVKLAFATQGRVHLQLVDADHAKQLGTMRTFGVSSGRPGLVSPTASAQVDMRQELMANGKQPTPWVA